MSMQNRFIFAHAPVLDTAVIRQHALVDNFHRGRKMVAFILAFSALFTVLVICGLTLKIRAVMPYVNYLVMLGIMILISASYLVLFSRKLNPDKLEQSQIGWLEAAVWFYVVFVICWGSVITLINHGLYLEMMVFTINIIGCSVVFIIEWKRLLAAYAAGVLILLIGLPFYVTDPPHLLSHYINVILFTIVAFLSALLLQVVYYRGLATHLKLLKANAQLTSQNSQIEQINDQLIKANFQLHQLSLIDELTGLANRRGLRNFISQTFEQNEQPISNLAVMMMDIDNFKLYNDHYGHPAGDQVLAAIAGVLAATVQSPTAIAARWGGEEFIVLLFNANEKTLTDQAESIRRQVEALRISHGYASAAKVVTVSIGVSMMHVKAASDVSMVIESADVAMYAAKEEGRNCVKNGLIQDGQAWAADVEKPVTLIAVDTPALAAEVARLADRIWREYYPAIIGQAQVDYMLEKFQNPQQIWQDISDKGFEYSIIACGGEAAGYLAIKINKPEKTMFLSKIYIDRKFRQLSLGRQTINLLIKRCRESKLHSIWLTVNKYNSQSIVAYEKIGFVKTESVVNDIGGGYVMDDFVMYLKLD